MTGATQRLGTDVTGSSHGSDPPPAIYAKLTAAAAKQQGHAVDLAQEQSPVGTAPMPLNCRRSHPSWRNRFTDLVYFMWAG